ncbi:RNA-binding cell elongation regulator Jag/EloR [Butyrivibrio sp. TB]|jgi:spoIIIJ-associated protein|uniref:RNA-binding cell elongation regulator Jag/EloR n=1 Tax=Butyrivibrio sp. TB TaxID=1520809 RepID=UPI0008D6F166|nr:RNA-binding cell elongation regulator Jag/EloR [Butyrivibrio sp. TB]SEQ51406.1 spoIIIJ-associated protein [Butyrivibrio sp. TB]
MSEYKEYAAKTVSEAITEACAQLSVTSDRLDYQVVSEGSTGFLGMGIKPAIIKARIKEQEIKAEISFDDIDVKEEKSSDAPVANASDSVDVADEAKDTAKKVVFFDEDAIVNSAKVFLEDVFKAMDMPVELGISFDKVNTVLNIDLKGADMGVLIGKRGQTLDSLQYLVSLVINRDQEEYIHVKVDTENYRQRRKATLENLAKNIAYKVRKTRRNVSLEPMNPYERRIIHSALQNDRYVTTHSEGEEPYRRVVVTLKK